MRSARRDAAQRRKDSHVAAVATAVVVEVAAAELLKKRRSQTEQNEGHKYTRDPLFTGETNGENEMAESKQTNSRWPIQGE